MYCLELEWHEFNVSIAAVGEWLAANIDEACVNLSANSKLQMYFASEPSDADKATIQAYWNALENDSDEAAAYQSAAAIEADRQAKKASAKAKLIALGLTEAEANAALGQ